ncbi:hypothetical protein HY373_01225 [Candidatus Berkelbacteria bacterium]|nr:hypothetical protein [Candidatus Berkelbacteria bacterium]
MKFSPLDWFSQLKPPKTEPQIPGLSATDKITFWPLVVEFRKLISSFFADYPLDDYPSDERFPHFNEFMKSYPGPAGTTITVHFDGLPDGDGFGLYAEIESENNPSVTILYGQGSFLWRSDGWIVMAPGGGNPFVLEVWKHFCLQSCDLYVRWNSSGYLVNVKFRKREESSYGDWVRELTHIEERPSQTEKILEFDFDRDGNVVAILPPEYLIETIYFREPPHLIHDLTICDILPSSFRKLVPVRIDLRWILAKVRNSLSLGEGEK